MFSVTKQIILDFGQKYGRWIWFRTRWRITVITQNCNPNAWLIIKTHLIVCIRYTSLTGPLRYSVKKSSMIVRSGEIAVPYPSPERNSIPVYRKPFMWPEPFTSRGLVNRGQMIKIFEIILYLPNENWKSKMKKTNAIIWFKIFLWNPDLLFLIHA